VRTAILTAAAELVRENGVGALSVNQVLDGAGLGTRAFYRHFESKDQLVSALFLEMAGIEARRLEVLMAAAPDAVGAVVAWIDGRLDLAFNPEIRSDLHQMSIEAQSQMFASPESVGPAYREILRPLVTQLERGRDARLFRDIDPDIEALSIQGAVWSNVERHWAQTNCDVDELRNRLQRFCLRGLGVSTKRISAVIGDRS
jgi:AcrR family transcriptional regulator